MSPQVQSGQVGLITSSSYYIQYHEESKPDPYEKSHQILDGSAAFMKLTQIHKALQKGEICPENIEGFSNGI